LQADRIKPELCDFIFPFNMDMWRLIPITREKEEALRPDS
jgi:hypothetical protein